MRLIFLLLASIGILSLLLVSAVGIAFYRFNTFPISLHILLGLLSSFYLVLIHTICMFHLIGSGKEIKQSAEELKEYSEVVSVLKGLKKKCFPLATFSMLIALLTVLTGGGAHTGKWFKELHQLIIIPAITINAYTFYIEYQTIKLNWTLALIIDLAKEGGNIEEHITIRG